MLYHLFLTSLIVASIWLVYKQARASVWGISFLFFSLMATRYQLFSTSTQVFLYSLTALFFIFSISPLRHKFLTQYIFNRIRKKMPKMSSTEREALAAGTISWEGELFAGSPNFNHLLGAPTVKLTAEEQSFLQGPLKTLCKMIDDWDITHNRADLPPEVWSFIKDNGFLGMIIPKRYGGLGFSATAQMSILVKLYGRSISAATTVAVPNSLGPAELLLKYGTEEQKNYYLPRLANGTEIPCFALTSPNAGSDAASIPDKGIVCYGTFQGKEVLGMKLTWNKRYITLCPVATVIGLAFRLYDPENLLGKGEDIGISCALIPADTPGIIRGRRHFPLNIAFLNGPTQGKDVFVPIDYLIGGTAMAGQGWRMLMECLSAGRAISLPSSASGGAQVAALGSGAYARIRKQFSQPIAKFEGIEEPLARIAANTYIIDSALTMAAAAIDQGEKPSVVGAILKYHTTERARSIALDAMDIHGGKGICLGPNNYLGRGYQGTPIGITVEGANILSRSLIIFGQGAIRCHPYVFKEMESVRLRDLTAFDTAFFGHVRFMMSNLIKSLFFTITRGYFSKAPKLKSKRFFQQIHLYSCHLAFLADFSMTLLGSSLKRKEKLSARLGDVLSYLYLASAVVKRYKEDNEPDADYPIVLWSCQHLFNLTETAIRGIIDNFPNPLARVLLNLIIQPFGVLAKPPSDKLGQKVSHILTTPNETRNRLTRLAYVEQVPTCPIGALEDAFIKICQVEKLEKKIAESIKAGKIKSLTLLEQIEEALAQDLMSAEEGHLLREAELARQDVIAVDDFDPSALIRTGGNLPPKKSQKVVESDLLAVS